MPLLQCEGFFVYLLFNYSNMRHLFLLTFILLVASCSDVEKSTTHKKPTVKRSLKGSVKRVEDYNCYQCYGTNIKLDSTGEFTVTNFDKEGNDTSFYRYSSYNDLFFKRTSKFDTNGFIINSETFFDYTDITQIQDYSYSNDWKIKTENSIRDKELTVHEYEYDNNGNEQKKYYLKDEVKFLVWEYIFDSLNHKIEIRNFLDGKPTSIEKIKNDSLGNPVEIIHNYLSIKRIAYSYFSYKYDSVGNWIERIEKNEYGDVRRRNKRVIEYY